MIWSVRKYFLVGSDIEQWICIDFKSSTTLLILKLVSLFSSFDSPLDSSATPPPLVKVPSLFCLNLGGSLMLTSSDSVWNCEDQMIAGGIISWLRVPVKLVNLVFTTPGIPSNRTKRFFESGCRILTHETTASITRSRLLSWFPNCRHDDLAFYSLQLTNDTTLALSI